jgi:ADP-heptose:LPS heptosyltransferase
MKILFYRNTRGIGDLAMMMKSVELTKQKYAKAQIDIACQFPRLIRDIPYIDNLFSIMEYENCNLNNFYDVIINQSKPCAEYESKVQPNIVKNRIELFCDNASFALKKAHYAGIEWDGLPQLLWINQKQRQIASRIVQNSSGNRVPIGIFWRSAESWRDWYKIHKLILALSKNPQYAIFCFDSDRRLDISNIYNIVKYPLDRVIGLVSQMGLIVSVDTLGIHLAGGLNIPILGIFGPTDPKIRLGGYVNASWMPIKCKTHPCWYKPCRKLTCFRKMSVLKTYDKIKQLLEK